MKDLVRLLMVAVLSFAVVGAALLYSRESDALGQFSSMLQTGAGKLDNVIDLGGQSEPVLPDDAADHTRLWIARPKQDVWIGLAGFPDQTEVRFPMPAGINLVSGALELEFESELAEHGDGRMTILVNGNRRGEIVLNTGREKHKVSIALDADDLLGSQILLELAGRGTTNSGQICPTDAANSGAAITILPTSGLALYTDDPIDRPDIRLAALVEPFNVMLGASAEDQARAIWAAQDIRRRGIGMRLAGPNDVADVSVASAGADAISLVDDRLVLSGEAGVDRLIHQRQPLALSQSDTWPVPVSALGAETVAKNFRGSRLWTLPYQIADLPAGLMPRQLALALKTSSLTEGSEWVVRVSLNGNLLVSQRFAGTVDEIALDVDLPTEMQGLSNSMLVELIDTSPNDSICRAGPDAQAQLLPRTELRASGGQPAAGWGELVGALARTSSIGIVTDTPLTLAQAQRSRALLQRFLPKHASVAFAAEANAAPVQLKMMPIGQVQALLDVASRLSGGNIDQSADLHFAMASGGDMNNEPVLIDLANPASRSWLAQQNEAEAGILIMR